MNDTYPYGERNWYPHMAPNDRAIYERFMAANKDAYDYVSYDVPCGDTPDFDVTDGGTLGEGIKKLYQKKIDVVGFKGTAIDVIEVKPRIGAGAIGQVMNYLRLYKRDYNPPEEPRAVIITDGVQPSVLDFAEDVGVRVIIV